MFGPDYKAGCPSCSAIADGFNGSVVHLANHDVTLMAVSRAPLAKLQEYKRRMGWTFPWASSSPSDFNGDFSVSFTEAQQRDGLLYNYRRAKPQATAREGSVKGPVEHFAAMAGTDAATYTRERPGLSAFVLEDGVVYHTYSTYSRGSGWHLGHVPVARPRAARTQRARPLVAAPRRVPGLRVVMERAFLGVSALLFAASVAVTIAWCTSMSAMGGMPMPGGWTMSMTWMRMPGQTWPGAAASFLGMWIVMTVAMMLPALLPALRRYRETVGSTAGDASIG